ncbi:ABC transporter B family member 15-like [Chenopodium quinoa]|uniref:ABC transporter B family member 15-like n=1 Tax=Chenopodium quinoa TaxID=63459 RepID=UPI000B773B5E|nr:ABC transporter B family member 15-like [Chenopodium quinoa]
MKDVMEKKGSLWSIFMHADGVDLILMVLGFIGAVYDGCALPITFGFTNNLINNVGSSSTFSSPQAFIKSVNKNVINLCIVGTGALFLCFLEGYCWTRTAERQTSRLRYKYLKAVLRQDVGYFDLNVSSTSEVIISVTNDSLIIQDVIGEKVPNFLRNASLFVSSYVAAFALLWRLAIVGSPFVVFLIIPGLMYGRMLMKLSRKLTLEYNKAASIAEQAISSIRTVYAFVEEQKTLSKFSAALDGSVKLGLRQGLAKGFALGSGGVVFAVWAFCTWYGTKLVLNHTTRGGTIYMVGAALVMGGLALGSSLPNIKYFSEAASAGEKMMELINRVPDIDSEKMDGMTLDNISGEVDFKHVSFAYPSRPDSIIFCDFSLQVPAGKTVALVGGSGSGKSTAVALLQRFYNPLGGEILLDGVSIDKLQLKWLRSQMGLVSQEPALFATTIKENILFGKEDATMDEVIEAATASNAHNFISQLPQGYDTQVGERGVQMSGGQKQRIAIARAIIKKPRVLLLDEATSALDSESERVVQEALDKAALGRTTIVIAHRLSTIHNADTIVVIQNGQVMEIGSHDELIQHKEGMYTSLVQLQQMEKSKDVHKSLSHPSTSNVPMSYNVDSRHSISSRTLSLGSRSSSVKSDHYLANELDAKPKGDEILPDPSFGRLLALNLPEWKQATLGCLGAMLFGAVQPLYAFSMGSLISVFFLEDREEIKRKATSYAWLFFGLAVITFIVNIVQHYYFAYMGEFLTKRVREKMLAKILDFEVGWFDQDENSTGAICSRLAVDANVVRSLVGDRMSLIVQSISAVATAVTMGLIISWKLAIFMLATQPLIICSFYARGVLLKKMSKKANKAQNESSKLAAEAISNLRIVTAFSSQDRILAMLDKAQEGPRKESIRQSWYAGFGLGAAQGLFVIIWATDFWFGSWLITHGQLTGKALFQNIIILVTTGRVIAEAGSMTSDLAKGVDVVRSVFAVLDRVTKIDPDSSDGFHPEKISGHIEIQDVHFSYPTRPDVVIFKGFSINIEAGKSSALVGQSGSGKSTIIGLIERFYVPLKGSVKIDGRDIQTYNLRSLRKHIALVNQEPSLFADTIRGNIAYGASDEIDESEIIEAAKAANAHDFISGLKDGYDTWCGDRGVQLSGGQKQRIAIARAILRNPSILLLDEATSALDSQSESIVQEALERVMVGRTSVVVAHRLSTIQKCDLIAVLEKGEVVEKGTHSSLLAKGPKGAYYSLVNLHGTPQ